MNSYVYYCIPTYKSFEECRTAVHSVYKGSLVPDQVVIIDNSGDASGTLALQDLTETYKNVHIWPQAYNIGVSKAWNTFHRELGRDFIIIANDDVSVHPQTIESLVNTARQHENSPIIYSSGDSGNAYSLFLLRHWAFIKYGGFDERFSPAYFEDNDMAYRLHTLNGFVPIYAHNATYDHVGSSTIKKYTQREMEMHHNSFRANRSYYIVKWGGLPGDERYTQPFDGEL